MSGTQIGWGIGLIVALAVGCQVVASRFRFPAIILLLPVGFAAGNLIPAVDPAAIFGDAFTPLVGLGVALVLFDGGMDLDVRELEGHGHRVVRRLLYLGIPITMGGAAALAWLLFGHSWQFAVMLGAIVIVSGPTVVMPLLEAARPGRRLTGILRWEGLTIDPIGAIIGVLVFQGLASGAGLRPVKGLEAFLRSVGVGAAGAAIGTALLWLLLTKLRVRGVLGTEVIIATVLVVAAGCDLVRADTGLIAAILMGVAVANMAKVELPQHRPFFTTIVQLVIGMLFVAISATVTPDSLHGVVGDSVVLVAGLVLLVRPAVALVATAFTSLTWRERAFVGWMDPRGIVAGSTAATFSVPLVAAGVPGAEHLLPVTFLVIVGTVTVYGLTAVRVAGLLGLHEPATGDRQDGAGPRD